MGSYRSFLYFWLGGAAVPSTTAVGGYRSFAYLWMGGAALIPVSTHLGNFRAALAYRAAPGSELALRPAPNSALAPRAAPESELRLTGDE